MAWTQMAYNMLGSAGNVIITILMILLGGGIIFYISNLLSYKHPAILREMTKSGQAIVHITSWKFSKNADGVEGIKFKKFGAWAEVTKEDAIEITGTGKKFIEAEISPTGQPSFLSFKVEKKNFEELTTTQRSILVNQTVNAAKRKRKKLLELIEKFAPLLVIAIIAISLMMMYADMAKPLLDMGDKLNKNQQIQLEQLKIIEELHNDIQILKEEVVPDIVEQEKAKENAPN